MKVSNFHISYFLFHNFFYRLVGLDVQQREDIGRQCKRLIDIGRLMYLERLGFKGHLVYYIDRELSLENVAMVAVPI